MKIKQVASLSTMLYIKTVAVLEVMWGVPKSRAPGFFRINANNFSGRRLYWLLGHNDLLVTNACRECVSSPSGRGTVDPERLARNLQRCSYSLLLLCGKIAQSTFACCRYTPSCPIIEIKHPAARNWRKKELEDTRLLIKQVLNESRTSS